MFHHPKQVLVLRSPPPKRLTFVFFFFFWCAKGKRRVQGVLSLRDLGSSRGFIALFLLRHDRRPSTVQSKPTWIHTDSDSSLPHRLCPSSPSAPLSLAAMVKVSSIANALLGAITHPNEAQAMISFSVWRDPLNKIEDHPETSGWCVHSCPSSAPPNLSGTNADRTSLLPCRGCVGTVRT